MNLMCRRNINRWFAATGLVLFVMAAPGCCVNGHKACEDIPPGAIPQPNGTYACQWVHAEMAGADRDHFLIYQYEWSSDGTKLTESGQEHLARIAQRLPQVSCPVVVELSSDPRLNEARRIAVLEALANCHYPIVPERVVLGRSDAEGLYGLETVGVAGRMLGNAAGGQGGGMMGGTSGFGGGGATGSLGGGSSLGGGGGGIY